MIEVDAKATDILSGFEKILGNAGVDCDVDFREILTQETGSLSFPRPLCNVSVNSAEYKRINMNSKFNCKMIVSLLIMVAEMSEKKNRRAILQYISAFDRVLFHADIGVSLQNRVEPLGFTNVTDVDTAGRGLMLYQLNYSCSYNTTIETEKDLGLITMIYNKYYLQEPSDDGVTDAEGQVDLDEVGSGDAAIPDLEGEEVFGGTPEDEFDDSDKDVYGGTPEST